MAGCCRQILAVMALMVDLLPVVLLMALVPVAATG